MSHDNADEKTDPAKVAQVEGQGHKVVNRWLYGDNSKEIGREGGVRWRTHLSPRMKKKKKRTQGKYMALT